MITTSDKGISIESKKDIKLTATGKLELKGTKGVVLSSSAGDTKIDGKTPEIDTNNNCKKNSKKALIRTLEKTKHNVSKVIFTSHCKSAAKSDFNSKIALN